MTKTPSVNGLDDKRDVSRHKIDGSRGRRRDDTPAALDEDGIRQRLSGLLRDVMELQE